MDRRTLFSAFYELANARGAEFKSRFKDLFADDIVWRTVHPINTITGSDDVLETVFSPLHSSFPDLERRDLIFMRGTYEGREYVGAVGHYCANFKNDWLTIPATGRPVWLRYGEIYEIAGEKIINAYMLWDVLDLMRQSGFWPIAPSLGTEGMWSGPITGDGIRLDASPVDQGAASLAQTLAMHKTLADYDDHTFAGREGLLTMPQKLHWHEKMMWYGPSGIGTTRSLAGFVDYHQLPFRLAYPNRKGGSQWDEVPEDARKTLNGGHYVRIGDGPYSLTSGWPSVYAEHSGGSILGTGGTGKVVNMRVMDFYLHHESMIRENWVPIDIIHILHQKGLDVFDRMQTFFRRGNPW
ncbi:MAG: nuclear transport factor 2 family protein [Pseudomonadota bacterium]